ncbi:MAG: hypothetical protein KF895_03220 [Parvibaculum sp.]|nr:hypothetical protein [Parvibaculum sp.]
MDNRLTPEEYEIPAETSGWETLAKISVGAALGLVLFLAAIAWSVT